MPDTLSKVIDRYNLARTAQEPRRADWERYYRLYRSIPDKIRKGRANLFVPETFALIETVAPRMRRAIFETRPILRYLPTTQLAAGNADVLTPLVDWQLDRADFETTADRWFRQALSYGTGVLKVSWERKIKTQRSSYPIQTPAFQIAGRTIGPFVIGFNEREEDVVVYDGPRFDVADLADFFVDPEATSMHDARWVIHRTRLPLSSLRGDDTYDQQALESLGEQLSDPTSPVRERMAALGYGGSGFDPYDPTVEILEYWDAVENTVTAVALETVVIRDEPNPFYHARPPFVVITDVPVPFEFWGIGEIEIIADLQVELNTKRNQRVDNLNLIINRMWKARRNARIDPAQLISRPGGVVEVDQMDDLEALLVPDVTGSSYAEVQAIRDEIQTATGVYDYSRGATPTRAETATAVLRLQQEANVRFQDKVLRFARGIEEVGNLVRQLDQQFLRSDQAIRLTGPEGVTFQPVSPAQIAGDYDVQAAAAVTDPAANQEARKQLWLQLYPLLAQNPAIDQRALTQKLLEVMGESDAVSLMAPEQPPMPPVIPAGAERGIPAGAERGMPGEAAPSLLQMLQGGAPDTAL